MWDFLKGVTSLLLWILLMQVCVNVVQSDGIREALVQYQLDKHEELGKIKYLAVLGGDPSRSLQRRLREHSIPIRPKSQAEWEFNSDFHKRIADIQTGESVVILGQGPILAVGIKTVKIYGGYYCGMLCSAGIWYTLERKSGKWVVTEEKLVVIS